ncbi:MAG TPA: DUF881 domain-containing protein [Jiangellales bacterium]|nr:DUF881 domain-containing protein [Jiangellales bacterium]
MRAKPSRGQAVVAVLVGVMGFAAVVQVRASEEDLLSRARRADLVQILDGLTQRSERLEGQVRELEQTRRDLLSGADTQATAIEQANARARQLAVLTGTAAATGPGIVLSVSDPSRAVPASVLLSTVQELRDAGAEAIQVEGSNDEAVRVVASTYFLDTARGVEVSGVRLEPPYTVTAIGDPPTLDTALNIPGGVVEEVAGSDGRATIRQEDSVTVDVLHVPSEPQYARPAPEPDDQG